MRSPPIATVILLYVAVAALYGASLWLRRPHVYPGAASGVVALALVVHAVIIVRTVFTPEGIDLSFPQAMSLVAWLTVLVALNNVFDARYIGSAFINPDVVNGEPVAFEPGMPRQLVLTLGVTRR